MKRLLSAFLTFVLILSVLFSCGDSSGTLDAESIASDLETEETTAEETTGKEYLDNLPSDLDFGGAVFRTIAQGSSVPDMYVAEEVGEILNDAAYRRNVKIEERLNVKIGETQTESYTDISNIIKKCVQSGDDAYDLVLPQMEQAGSDALSGYYLNWYDIPYVTLDSPWYPKHFTNEGVGTVNGRMYILESDLVLSYTSFSWAMVYDKVFAGNYGITGVYDIVRDGGWTLDTLIGFTKDIYEDVNGDGKKDIDDFYGLIYRAEGCSFAADLYALGIHTVEITDGAAVMTLQTEKAADAFDKIYRMLQNEGTLQCPVNGVYCEKIFPNERGIFCTMAFIQAYTNMKNYENDYGFIPLPKWDEQQSEYYSTTDAGSNSLAVPITASNLEFTGAVTEALSAESCASVMPLFCDISLGQKMARDEESIEMINLALDSRYVDFAYLYDAWKGWTFTLSDFVKKEGAFASSYEKKAAQKQKFYDKAVAYFYDENV